VISHLDHIAALGVDGLWLTPVFASPQRDFGYDVSDYLEIHHEFGTRADVETLIEQAHRRGLAILLDMVLPHTSIDHRWFRDHPDRYHWEDSVPNNWRAVFGGPAWEHDAETGRYYYHRYYSHQPSLNWGNPDVRIAMHDIIGFWVDRGADGFRLDALDGLAIDPALRDEPAAADAGMIGREADAWADYWALDHIHTSNLPQVAAEVARLRQAFPTTAFVVEADLDNNALGAYTAHADCAFSFEFFRAPLDGTVLARILDTAGHHGAMAWALSNHDFSRLVSRWGRDRARMAAMLLLTLPGWSFVYQGDEVGMTDGPGAPVAYDLVGRDRFRHPMQWTREGGFTTGTPWLPMIDPAACNVADQAGRGDSMLELYRRLITVRRQIEGPLEVLDASATHLSFRRGRHRVVLNLGDDPLPAAPPGMTVVATAPPDPGGGVPPRTGVLVLGD
jgi:alpha-glucosidase